MPHALKTRGLAAGYGDVPIVPDLDIYAADLALRCEVAGETKQEGTTADLLFPPAELVSYITQFASLEPGDLILTGTPAGAGPDIKESLMPGQLMVSFDRRDRGVPHMTVAEAS